MAATVEDEDKRETTPIQPWLESQPRFRAALLASLAAAFLSIFAAMLVAGARLTSQPNAASASPASNRAAIRVGPDRLNEAMRQGVEFLNRASQSDGQFLYRVNLNPKVEVKPKYNFLRHAGTIYALATYQQSYPSETTRATLDRSLDYLLDRIEPVAESPQLLALWSRPQETGGDHPDTAKLGGSGLALVALLSAEDAGAEISLEQLRRLARFILFMQKSDGSFYSKYIPAEGGRSDRWTSLYYPGEAAFGLLLLYERDPQPQWLQAAANAIAYLARQRAGKEIVEADHWALLATARLLPHYESCDQPIPRQQVIAHGSQICNSILAEHWELPTSMRMLGAFGIDGRTCPAATRLEGLLAARSFLAAEDDALLSRIEMAIDRGIPFLIRAQVSSGEHVGGIPRAFRALPWDDPRYDQRATEIRIDYVQHAVSAMLAYQQWRFPHESADSRSKP